jgi:uncharacterized protein
MSGSKTLLKRKPKPSSARASAIPAPSAAAPAPVGASTDDEQLVLPPCNNEWFELRRSPIAGIGAFAKKDIPRRTRMIEYAGEKISNEEAERRYPDTQDTRHHTFLFTLNSKWAIDAAVNGNEARFINHSCEPNCEAVITRHKIWIETLGRIKAGTELSYDYQFEYLDNYTEKDLAYYLCTCGSPNCRGTIVEPKPEPKKGKKTASK